MSPCSLQNNQCLPQAWSLQSLPLQCHGQPELASLARNPSAPVWRNFSVSPSQPDTCVSQDPQNVVLELQPTTLFLGKRRDGSSPELDCNSTCIFNTTVISQVLIPLTLHQGYLLQKTKRLGDRKGGKVVHLLCLFFFPSLLFPLKHTCWFAFCWLPHYLNKQEPTQEQTGRTGSDRRYKIPNLSRKKRKSHRWPSRATTYWVAAQVELHRPASRSVGAI